MIQENPTLEFLLTHLEKDPNNPILHNNLANAYRQNHQWSLAAEHYQQAIILQPDYAEAHHNLAALLAIQNDYAGALRHYRDALHAAPDFVQAHYHLGLLLLKHQELEAAAIQFKNVLELQEEHLAARFYHGLLHLQANRLIEAKKAFETVIQDDPQHIEALNNLGVIAIKQHEGQPAVDFFTKVLTLDNDHQEARNNLAATFISHDRFENALIHYRILLDNHPNETEYLYNASVACMSLGELQEATKYLEHLITAEPHHVAGLSNLATIAIRLKQKDRAIVLLKRALAINPGDKANQHMLTALEGQDKTPIVRPDYAANLFNNYALYYEKHLQTHLKYQIPHHLEQICTQLNIREKAHTLDLGCGTGLCGDVLRTRTERLTGVDIADKMIQEARKKNIYDDLFSAEITQFLKEHPTQYDLIVIADTLPYFGELAILFKLIKQHLQLGGQVIFTTEISEDNPWQLQDSARFCHHIDYLKQICADNELSILEHQIVPARLQDDRPLMVHFLVLVN